MYKCPFCENLSYDWDDDWSIEKKKEIMKLVSDHVYIHPEAQPKMVEKTDPETKVESDAR
jgi:hypothetical protein